MRWSWLFLACHLIGCGNSPVAQVDIDAGADCGADAGGPFFDLGELPAETTVTLATCTMAIYALRSGGGSLTRLDDTHTTWTLGKAPVVNTVQGYGPVSYYSTGDSIQATWPTTVRATLAKPYATESFGDVNDFLTAQKNDGSTEDCAFSPAGKLTMGVPGGLIQLGPDGKSSVMKLTGDPLVAPLGLFYDKAGTLWVADSKGPALRSVSLAGEVTTVVSSDGTQNLSMPNDVVTIDGKNVYFTDSCLGEVLFVKDGKVMDVAKFDLAKEGGANGVALDPDGKSLWVTTENTGLLCQSKGVGPEAPISGLYRFELLPTGFGKRTDIAVNQGLFGDGLTFDSEGNLYVIFDQEADFALTESTVWVLAKGDTKLLKFLTANDRVFANPVFGKGAFGETQLYLALLAVPGFTDPSARGLMRFDVGIKGL